jgi:DUF1680 family protein
VNSGNALWNWQMLVISGDGQFADVMELVFDNGRLSQQVAVEALPVFPSRLAITVEHAFLASRAGRSMTDRYHDCNLC